MHKDWVGQVFFSSFKTNSRGVAILIHKHTPFEVTEQISDTEGRYILIKGKIWDKELTLLNIYAPNTDTPSFISDMISLFNTHCRTLGIIGGDYNLTLSNLDKSSHSGGSNPKSAITLNALGFETGLIDVWRVKNPTKRDYTFFPKDIKLTLV